MKIAPIIEALKAAQARGGGLRYRLIHTGRHYDKAMSGSFFERIICDIHERRIVVRVLRIGNRRELYR